MLVVEVIGPGGEPRLHQIDRDEAIIGRRAGSDILLPEEQVSRSHARLVRSDDAIVVIDLGSTNGTYVGQRRLTSPLIVRGRETLSICGYLITVHAVEPAPARERSPLPYLARDPAERRLLAAIAERDEAARVVYADWLEQRGELARAEFLRVQQQIIACSADDPRFEALASQLGALAASIDVPWRAQVARPPIERCPVAFELSCPKEWGKLEPTEREGVRYCGACQKTVHYASTVASARQHAERGDCVALDVAALRGDRDLDPPYDHFVCPRCDLDVGPSPLACPRCRVPTRGRVSVMTMGRVAY